MSLEELEPDAMPAGDPRLDQVVALLTSMNTRMARLEDQVAALTRGGAPVATPVAQAVEAAAVRAADRGVDVDARVQAGASLAEALTEPRTLAVVERLIERLDTVDQGLMAMGQVPDLAADAVDTVDRLRVAARESGIRLDARLQASVALAERLTDPDTVEALLALTDHAGSAARAAAFLEQLPELAAGARDTLERVMHQLHEEGFNLDARLQGVVAVTTAATEPRTLAALERLLGSPERIEQLADLVERLLEAGGLHPDAVSVVQSTSAAMVQTQTARPAPVGAFGAVSALFDPDVQRTLGFVVAFARSFGQRQRA